MSKKTIDNLGVSAFCESMAMMTRAGIQIDEAIHLLSRQGEQAEGLLGQALAIMADCVEKGSGLAQAMRQTDIFPEYALKMIEAGEAAGRLENVLFRLADYYRDQKTIADKLRSAVTYPAAMLVMIILVLMVMIAMVLPAFNDVYSNLTGSLTGSSYSYIHWAYGFCWFALIVMVILAVLLLLGRVWWNGNHKGIIEMLLRRVGLCASLLDNMGLFRFTSALETYLASGEMQDSAVRQSIAMADCRSVERKLQQCLADMDEGHSFAQAAYTEKLFEPIYGRMLLAGERSGNLEEVLRRLNSLLEETCSAQVDRLVGIMDPLLSGILMATVGLSLLSVMLPLIGIMNAIA